VALSRLRELRSSRPDPGAVMILRMGVRDGFHGGVWEGPWCPWCRVLHERFYNEEQRTGFPPRSPGCWSRVPLLQAVLPHLPDGHELDDERVDDVELHLDLLPGLHGVVEEVGGQDVAVDRLEVLPVGEDFPSDQQKISEAGFKMSLSESLIVCLSLYCSASSRK